MSLLQYISNSFSADFFSPGGYFFLGWLFLYPLVGIFLYYYRQPKTHPAGKKFSIREGLKSCFPLKTFWGTSAKLDYQIILVSHYLVFYPMGLILLHGQSRVAHRIAPWAADGFSIFGKFHIPVSNGFWTDFVYTLLALVAADLGWTVQHILFHRVPYFWGFHKVHHSATELNIFTIARVHPVELLAQGWAAGISVGVLMGFCKFFLGNSPSLVLILNASWAMALYRVLGIFRHSPIWISFGPRLSYFFSSPAMHQIHHSREEIHYDRNFATVFSFWDYLFGTLYIPKAKENLKFGINSVGLDQRTYSSLVGSLLNPLIPKAILNAVHKQPSESVVPLNELRNNCSDELS